jgi:catechol 2,3-dioxygenase-like lactoylglutathione lyase family enzyme
VTTDRDRRESLAPIRGVHHVRVPVSDVFRSRDWYMDVLDLEPVLTVEEADDVVGIVLGHPSGVVLGLHLAAERAAALRGFAVLALSVGDRSALDAWARRLETIMGERPEPVASHLGWSLHVADPDGVIVQLHTSSQPAFDEA